MLQTFQVGLPNFLHFNFIADLLSLILEIDIIEDFQDRHVVQKGKRYWLHLDLYLNNTYYDLFSTSVKDEPLAVAVAS